MTEEHATAAPKDQEIWLLKITENANNVDYEGDKYKQSKRSKVIKCKKYRKPCVWSLCKKACSKMYLVMNLFVHKNVNCSFSIVFTVILHLINKF